MKGSKTILVDLYKMRKLHSGLGQYSINYYHQLISSKESGLNFRFLMPRNFQYDDSDKYEKVNIFKRYFPIISSRPDLWHSLHQFPSHKPPPEVKQLLTIHDLNFLKEKDEGKAAHYLRKLQKNVDRADYLATISDYTRRDILQHLHTGNKEIRIIYPGVKSPDAALMKQPPKPPGQPFFFSIGIFTPKKNFHVLVEMMRHLENYKLVLAGDQNTSYGSKLREQIRKYGLKERVIICGRISEEEKSWYYHHCEALLFPSLAEGFGLPPVEAMLCGKPVFLSKEASLPEIGGDVAFYWDNFDPESMADKVLRKINKMDKKKTALIMQEYARQFNWKQNLKSYSKYYRDILFQ